jgi:hypothetical protein
VPLSLIQEHMWALEQWAPVPGFYNEVLRHWFPGPVDRAALARALGVLVRRHESLRTTFPLHAGQPYQSIGPPFEVELPVTDIGHVLPAEQAQELHRLQAAEQEIPFDVSQGPLFRARLFELGAGASELCVVFDHLVSDATSAAILDSELDEAYGAIVHGRELEVSTDQVDYADFAVWQRQWMTEERLHEHYDFWRAALRGLPSERRVPYRREIRDSAAAEGSDLVMPPAMHAFTVVPDVHAALRRTQRSSGFVLAVAAVAALVARSTGEPDILLVTSVGGRDRAELEGVVGLFGGTTVLRVDLSGDPAFEVVLRRARASVLGVLEHQHLPFSRVFDAVARDGIHPALSRVPVAVHFFHAAPERWAPGTSVVARPPAVDGPVELELPDASKPLEFRFYDDGTSLWCELFYHRDQYGPDTAARVVADVQALLAAAAGDPSLRLSELPMSAPAPTV